MRQRRRKEGPGAEGEGEVGKPKVSEDEGQGDKDGKEVSEDEGKGHEGGQESADGSDADLEEEGPTDSKGVVRRGGGER